MKKSNSTLIRTYLIDNGALKSNKKDVIFKTLKSRGLSDAVISDIMENKKVEVVKNKLIVRG